MDFTYDGFVELINGLINNGYIFSDYGEDIENAVIMRHDVDYSLEKTVRIGEIERNYGIKSTFFLMLTSDFYNVFQSSSEKTIKYLLSLGHDVGLHFDEMRYLDYLSSPKEIVGKIIQEAEILSIVTGKKVTKVSMHRPSIDILKSNLRIPGIINTYSSKYFNEYKYLSDSRMRWREPALDIINGRQYDRFQILVHPFWYNDEQINLEENINRFVNSANLERYHNLDNNFTNLVEIMKARDVKGV